MPSAATGFVLKLRAYLCAGFAFTCAAMLFTQTANAQSMRRGLNAPSPTKRARIINPPPERDIDVYLGKVIRRDGNIIIVNITTNFRSPDRKVVFFGCDATLKPTSILKPTGITHLSCAAFEIAEGDALVGDSVMAKYFAPEKEEQK